MRVHLKPNGNYYVSLFHGTREYSFAFQKRVCYTDRERKLGKPVWNEQLCNWENGFPYYVKRSYVKETLCRSLRRVMHTPLFEEQFSWYFHHQIMPEASTSRLLCFSSHTRAPPSILTILFSPVTNYDLLWFLCWKIKKKDVKLAPKQLLVHEAIVNYSILSTKRVPSLIVAILENYWTRSSLNRTEQFMDNLN